MQQVFVGFVKVKAINNECSRGLVETYIKVLSPPPPPPVSVMIIELRLYNKVQFITEEWCSLENYSPSSGQAVSKSLCALDLSYSAYTEHGGCYYTSVPPFLLFFILMFFI